MSFLGLHKTVTYLVAGLGLYALTLGFEIGAFRTALFAVGYLASWLVSGDLVRRPGWGRAWTQIVVGAFVVQVLRSFLGTPTLELAVEYAALLQISRLFNRRDGRDHQQIAVLAFLHLVAATVLTTDLAYAFVFLGFVIVIPWMLALSHLRREIEEHYPAPARREGSEEGATDVRRVLRSRRLIGAPFLVGTALLVVPLVLSTMVLFLAFPRVGLGVFSFGQHQGQPVVGFGRDVRLGGFGVLRNDPTVVARVTLPDRAPDYLAPPLRLRGTSFDRYDGRVWRRSDAAYDRMPNMFGSYFPISRWGKGTDSEVEITVEHLDEPVVFIPDGTVGLRVRPRQRRGIDVPRKLVRGAGLDIRYADADEVGLRYTAIVSATPTPIEGPDRSLEAEERARYLQLPDGPAGAHGPVARLAARLVGGATEPRQKVQRIAAHLLREDLFSYSLELPRIPPGADPLTHFLFEARRGHCEYFSTALAVMLRTQGVPTRNVTGFLGGSRNRFGGYYAIRQGDAHSWVEVWVDGDGWRAVDPTPASREHAGPAASILDGARAFFDALRARWLGYVVTYDLQTQIDAALRAYDFLARARATAGGVPGLFDDEATAPAAGSPRRDRVFETAGVLAGAALLLGVVLLVRRLRRRRRDPALAGLEAGERRAVRAYRVLDRTLARSGWARPPNRTPADHAAHLVAEGAPGSDHVDRITSTYLEARYASRSPSEEELDALDEDLVALRAILAKSHGHRSVRARR